MIFNNISHGLLTNTKNSCENKRVLKSFKIAMGFLGNNVTVFENDLWPSDFKLTLGLKIS